MEGTGKVVMGDRSGIGEGPAEGTAEEARRNGLTPRAFVIGVALCAFLGLALPYNRMIVQGSWMNLYFMDRGSLFVFFCLVFLANPLVRLVKRRYALSRGELLAVYAMFLFLLPASGMVKNLISYLTGVSYYATPERRDLEAVLPYIMPWTAPQETDVVRGLYEGLPAGGSVPWVEWLVPMVSWGSFLMVLFVVLTCLAVIMRKQWEEHERFAFPIVQVPLEMAETGTGWLGPLFKNRLMWAGFAIPFLIGAINGLHNYFYTLPQINLGTIFYIFRQTTPLPLQLHFSILGYSYFVNLDVSLSIWLFNVISKVIRGMLAVVGMEFTDVSGTVGRFSSRGSAFLALMGMGYILALAGYSVWMARVHLRRVFEKAFGRAFPLDDSEEAIPYRAALIAIGAGLLYLACWLYQTGTSIPLILFLFFSCAVVFLVLNRIVSETGFVATYSPLNPSEFVVCAVGSSAFSPMGLVTLGFGYSWTMTRTSNLMPHAQGALRLTRDMLRKRGLIWAMVAAMAIGLVATSYMTLNLGYTYGGLNLDRHFHDYSRTPFEEFVGGRMLKASPVFTRGFWYAGLGMGIAVLLMILRTRFVWWPLHPVALPISTIWYTDTFFFSVFLAWGIKAAVLKFGGSSLYRRTRIFFIGIILGEAAAAGMWIVIDCFTGMIGNRVLP